MALNRLVSGIKLQHHSIYTEYRAYNKILDKNKVSNREELRKIIDCICKHIGQGVTDYPGGVIVEELGYFFIWMPPRKGTFGIKKEGGIEEGYNYHTNHHMYFPTFLPFKPKVRTLQAWTMDKTFCNNIKQELCRKLKEGGKYRMYTNTLKQI